MEAARTSSKSPFRSPAELDRRSAVASREGRAEGPWALVADGQRDRGNRQLGLEQELPRPLEALRAEVLAGRGAEELAEGAKEVVLGEARHPCDLGEGERRVGVLGLDQIARAMEPAIELLLGRGAE